MTILTAATYNVHEWVGTDGRREPERILEVIRQLDADVVALQEVALPRKPAAEGIMSDLERATGMHAVAGPTFVKKDADYGNLLLSRQAVERIEMIDLSVDVREPRGAICASLCVEGVPLKIIATHLGLRVRERKHQWLRLIEKIDRHADEIVVLMGDFNEWNPLGRNARWLRSFFGGGPAPCTFPSWRTLLALDRILVYPKGVQAKIRVCKSKLARAASDHLPVVARIEL